jgi:hypothetical protein
MKQLISLLAVALAAASCHKTSSDPDAHVLAFLTDSRIRVNQAAIIYDSTALKDSIDFVNPPTGAAYIWQVSPDNGAAVWTGKYRYGLASVAFTRSGSYQVKAEIYDTIAGRMLAHTNTVTVQVGKDTLYQFYNIHANDTLVIRPTIFSTSINGGPAVAGMQLSCTTTGKYEFSDPYLQLMIVPPEIGKYNFRFSDSLAMTSYPYAPMYQATLLPVNKSLELPGFSAGMTIGIEIVWLRRKYTGTLTMDASGKGYSVSWDNSGAVRFEN